MAYLEGHGGRCCGRRHLYNMNGATTESIRRDMAAMLRPGVNKITEIVVSEENDNLENLREEIVGAGFVLVAEWLNCSGSTCYMYLHANDWTAFPNGAPQQVLPQPVPEVRVEYREAPVRVVGSTFHNVLAAGRSDAGWSTRESAAAAARPRRIDRRDIMSDGTVRWTEGV